MNPRLQRLLMISGPQVSDGGNMHEIVPGLWLGSWNAANDATELKRMGITHILSVGRFELPHNFQRLQIPVDDEPEADLLSHFADTSAFIDSALQSDGRILVHCQAGISTSFEFFSCRTVTPHRTGRSATVVAAYFIATYRLTPESALDLIRERRSFIWPNEGFLRQLATIHATQCADNTATPLQYIQRTARRVVHSFMGVLEPTRQ
ncbi:phosphatases II [Exidia glandulosa HHB12029]|uniref:protein-tyrosine-phosphatase n=1 Tax=Exidia glandulosa HHB12029 TaxID=1314781 RepID=A0A165MS03_EXIGL|nr:phosphatases II [Exidia glandulosa HHB12029]